MLKQIAEALPGLEPKLHQAGLNPDGETFLRKSVIVSILLAVIITVFFGFLSVMAEKPLLLSLILFPLLFALFLFYFLKTPDLLILKKQREIASEIVFAGRFLVIQVESGTPLYRALVHMAENYPIVGMHLKEMIVQVEVGDPIENAIQDAIEHSPSSHLRRVLWQIVNALHTGGDVAKALSAVLDQMAKEQMIEVQQYGKKLNPLAMFYLTTAVIIPTLGTTMGVIIANFFEIYIGLEFLLGLVAIIAFLQFIFLSAIKTGRPSVDIA